VLGVAGLIMFLLGLLFLFMPIILNLYDGEGIMVWGLILAIAGGALLRAAVPMRNEISIAHSRIIRIYYIYYSGWYLIWLVLTIIIIGGYALEIYPSIPHSLGGAKPRCAYLDIDSSKISADSRSTLFSADGDSSNIRRSDAVDVYYAGDNWLLVKIAPSQIPGPLKETFEIDRDVITSITWC